MARLLLGLVICAVIFSTAEGECCNTKTVGDFSYTRVLIHPDYVLPLNCRDDCVYKRDDQHNSRFCFASGSSPVYCKDEDPVPIIMTAPVQEVYEPYLRGLVCEPNSLNQFILSVNVHSPGRMGEYQVEGCPGTSPVLAIQRGVAYTLVQQDISNWMHPLGLAYYPDGAHGFQEFDEVPELEHPTPADCNEAQFNCNPGGNMKQAPLYGIDGVYESYDDWNNGVTSGLDVYEVAFKVPQDQWRGQNYSVKITVPLESKTREFFYFCHIHHGMSGLINVTDPVQNANSLVQQFDPHNYYKQPTKFDSNCGTSEVSMFNSSKKYFCPGQNFLCKTQHNKEFSECMEAIGCKINYEMRVEENSNPLVVFMHQMIPHHVNAVNMARIALKHAQDAVGYDDEDLDVPGLIRDIISVQNNQIQEMEDWLKKYNTASTAPQYCIPPTLSSG